MAFGFGFGFTRNYVAALFSPASLFANGEQGAWYDPSDYGTNGTLFQDSAGTIPVTAVQQPVGRMLDKSGRGNHAFQTTSASRPVLSARYNLLTKTEQFDDAVWGKVSCTVTNQGGGIWRLQAAAGSWNLTQSVALTNANSTLAMDVKANGTAFNDFRLVVSGIHVASHTATSDWTRVSSSGVHNNNVTCGVFATAGAAAIDILIRFPDLRVSNDALSQPAYQRVNTATDYDTVGFKPYLAFDGVDDSLVTNSIDFTSTDKMTVFAGVRSFVAGSDYQPIAEFSSNWVTNAGSFALWGSVLAVNRLIESGSRGTAGAAEAQNAFISGASNTAPFTSVLSATHDIAGDLSTIRFNGVTGTNGTLDKGTGNFGNYPLFIGRRNQASLPFNGRLYSLIVRGAASTTAQITSTETYVNQKTGAYT